MTDITKSAPLPERPCEQLTCCAVCTCEIKHEHDSRDQAGGQGYQSGERLLVAFRRLGHFAKKSSMANLSGLEDKKGFVFSTLDNSASSRSMVFSCFCRMISSSCVCVSCFGDSVLLVIVCTCKAMRRSTSHHGADSDYSDSLALRRWRRLISPFAAVTKKPAVLSPGSLSCSISSITSCGILTVVICDFAFFAPVAISGSPKNWCMSVYAKKNDKKSLKCISPVSKLKSKVKYT
ncbi:ash family protein [Escherichia coli]|nr:ash family protein [Escherichia coli]